MPSGNTLKGKSFTITGAGSGIGRQIALASAGRLPGCKKRPR
jgi:NAD(P)-dependent dehydrogenase (short-subunit alcohol dehydrogenase family)